MSTVQAALEDINWLSKRLKGIITLSEEIKTYDTMKTQTEEFKTQLSSQKTELTKFIQKIKDKELELSKLLETHQSIIESHNKQVDVVLSKARTDAEEVRQKAERDAQALRMSSQADKISIDKEIYNQTDRLSSLRKEVQDTSNILSSLQKHISELKAKF